MLPGMQDNNVEVTYIYLASDVKPLLAVNSVNVVDVDLAHIRITGPFVQFCDKLLQVV